MIPNVPATPLPPNVARKLRAIRRRAWFATFAGGFFRALAVLIAAMLCAMSLDWAIGWFDAGARYASTIVTLAVAVIAFVAWCLRPIARRRSMITTAQVVDHSVPELEERWSTVAELSQSQDAPEVRGSEDLIRQVAQEADAANSRISPTRIVSLAPMVRAMGWFAGAAALLALWLAVSFTQSSVLLKRFWMPGKSFSLTRVTVSPADIWVPKGEAMVLEAKIEGRAPSRPPRVMIRAPQSGERILTMSPKSGAADVFQQNLNKVTETFEYRVRAGDGESPWARITAADRPKITQVHLKVSPPAYSRLPVDEQDALPPSVRVLHGSDVEVSFRSDQPLEHFRLDLGQGSSVPLEADAGGWYRFRSRPTNSFAFTAEAINQYQLVNKAKPGCRISVYDDLPPAVRILEPSDDLAILPGEKVDITFEASDDFGLASADIIVATTKADGETNLVTLPVNLEAATGTKELRKTVHLDPKALGLGHGDQLSYVVQVTDTKQAPAQTGGEGRSGEGRSQGQSREGRNLAASEKPAAEKQAGEARDDSPRESASNEAETRDDSTQNAKDPAAASSTARAPADSKAASGSQPPPNEMAMRNLDVGQTAACRPRNISVDEWAGTFDGEQREKLELAIEPVLKQLDSLLAKSQEAAAALGRSGSSKDGFQESDRFLLGQARGPLGESSRIIAEWKSTTTATPYAFIGLQLHNIGEAHVVPADVSLGKVSLNAAHLRDDVGQVEQASFHIIRAREMLADLTRTYESVKRDQKIADAMQRLSKMYQVFLEDTQALLGSAQAPINTYDRKVAEVDDAYVEKLKALLEEKKRIMDELAKLLADDPRLLRRYLAMMEQHGTSYRDQMTLLAERQKVVADLATRWSATPQGERPGLLDGFRPVFARQRADLLREVTQFRENLETWLPLDVKTDEQRVKEAMTRAERILLLMSEKSSKSKTPSDAGLRALAELRALHESLPQLGQIVSTNQARMSAYVANRLAETEALITAYSGQLKIEEALGMGDIAKVAEVMQHRLAVDTATLGEKLDTLEGQVSGMSEAIAEKAASLNEITQTQILPSQGEAVDALSERDVSKAESSLARVIPAFERAETTFDELLRLMIAKLDEAPPPTSPGGAQDLASLLAMLEDEMKANEGLGIPCRPINVSIMRDWMRPGSNPGQGQGQGRTQARAAQAQAQQAQAESERLERNARASARKALAQAKAAEDIGDAATLSSETPKARGEAWNKLASSLQKDLLQGRDNTPPEQYRSAIDNYFRIIAGAPDTRSAPNP